MKSPVILVGIGEMGSVFCTQLAAQRTPGIPGHA